ncbi:MAG: hypothetical protein HDR33_08230 [Treponema sp.]|nr:hypothetical protein [Treponema sp.]
MKTRAQENFPVPKPKTARELLHRKSKICDALFFMGSRARENMERSRIFSQETTRYAGGGQGLIAKKLSSEAIQ